MADFITAPIPGMSGSTGYAQGNLDATKAYQNTLTRLNQQRLSTLQNYGYTGTVDPTNGTLSGIAVDQHNPYGNLQQMLRQNALQDQQAQWAAQDRGLRGGLANQGVSNLKYGEGQASSQLGTALSDALAGFQDQQGQAAYTRDAALYQAEQQAAQDAILNGLFNQADMSGLTYPDYGQTGADPTTVEGGSPAAKKILAQKLANAGFGGQQTGVKVAGKTTTIPAVLAKAAKLKSITSGGKKGVH